jgi:hypothetical protein
MLRHKGVFQCTRLALRQEHTKTNVVSLRSFGPLVTLLLLNFGFGEDCRPIDGRLIRRHPSK